MPKDKAIRQEKKKGLSDKELIAKYEAGEQPVAEMVKALLDKKNPNAPAKTDKKRD
jgi:hypothetical protein